ncbi:MAG: cupin [Candidatus Methylacidiphilales bacterium]|nr:hypothetical protein [Candidatus Methylacidiphilales bacterium]
MANISSNTTMDVVNEVRPLAFNFASDDPHSLPCIPNSRLPLLVYRKAFTPRKGEDLAQEIVQRFESNNWTGTWINGIYNYHHFHSKSHEVLGISAGYATVHMGGEHHGRLIEIQTGDVLVIPAGVGHKRVSSSEDFQVVGAYPDDHEWDILRGTPAERAEADHNIAEVPLPDSDPIYGWGENTPLMKLWK